MSRSNGNDYEVGYRKPPVATRWQKGQSGNPRGPKPKEKHQQLDPGKILQDIDNEEIFVNINGKRKRMKKAEIQIQQLFTKAFKEDLTAARLIAKMAAEHLGPKAESPSGLEIVIVPDKKSSPNRKANRGRPRQARRQVSAGSLFRKVAREQVDIEVDGTRVTMSRWDAYVRQIYTMALNKDNRAARLLDQLRRQFPGDLPPGDKTKLFISENQARY